MSQTVLLKGDCLELMKDIPDKSIDMILCDPPYGTTACKWDQIIPFELMWSELKRIRKDNSAICLFGSEPFSSHLRLSNIKEFKYDWIWNKKATAGFVNAKLKPMSTIEIVSVFSNGKTSNGNKNNMRYFPQGLVAYNKKAMNGNKNKSQNDMNVARPSWKSNSGGYIQEWTNYPRNYIEYARPYRAAHPTQKPVPLLEYLIKTYTLEGQIVLDFTMGSGSTGVACKNTNRDFIGIELDDKYFEIAQKRIESGT